MGQALGTRTRITNQDRAILDMKLQRDKLKQYQKRIENVLKLEEDIARQAVSSNNKSKALIALRKKKFQENLLSKTDQQLETLQNLVSSIEFSLIEKDVLFGLNQGNQILKEIHKELSLENVERLMSDTADSIAYQNEVSELLMSRMTNDEEAEVQKELEILQALNQQVTGSHVPQEETEKPASLSTVLSLPDVPTTSLEVEARNEPIDESSNGLSAARTEEREAILA